MSWWGEGRLCTNAASTLGITCVVRSGYPRGGGISQLETFRTSAHVYVVSRTAVIFIMYTKYICTIVNRFITFMCIHTCENVYNIYIITVRMRVWFLCWKFHHLSSEDEERKSDLDLLLCIMYIYISTMLRYYCRVMYCSFSFELHLSDRRPPPPKSPQHPPTDLTLLGVYTTLYIFFFYIHVYKKKLLYID